MRRKNGLESTQSSGTANEKPDAGDLRRLLLAE
jgi:hypothetical protein